MKLFYESFLCVQFKIEDMNKRINEHDRGSYKLLKILSQLENVLVLSCVQVLKIVCAFRYLLF